MDRFEKAGEWNIRCRVQIETSEKSIQISTPVGHTLMQILRDHGIAYPFPCGGMGKCGGCVVRASGALSKPSKRELELLGARGLSHDHRLACATRIEGDAIVALEPQLSIESEEQLSPAASFSQSHAPSDQNEAAYSIAVDIGTTTLTAFLLRPGSGMIQATFRKNPQTLYGADLITRISFAGRPKGLEALQNQIRSAVDQMIQTLLLKENILSKQVHTVGLVGNTCMHHLFWGLSTRSLGQMPFEPHVISTPEKKALDVGLNHADPQTMVRFLPNIAGFVGSDILAASIHCGLHIPSALGSGARLLIDIGTNGEIVLVNDDQMFCCSTAAGPAFEGMNITHGMLAVPGAIDQVWKDSNEKVRYTVIGDGHPKGICGSALIQWIALLIENGAIHPNGRIHNSQPHSDGDRSIKLPEARHSRSILLTQKDIRQVQLAKGAIRAGVDTLLERMGIRSSDLDQIYLAGHFGAHLDIQAIQKIGLIPSIPSHKVKAVGNAACKGLATVLLDPQLLGSVSAFQKQFTHIPLHNDPQFIERFAQSMRLEQDAKE